MADTSSGTWPDTFKRWWLRPLVLVVVLLGMAAGLVFLARYFYGNGQPGFRRELATGALLNGAAVVLLGAIVTTALSIAAEFRSRRERTAERRFELFHRMRTAHVRVALTQQILRSQQDPVTYQEQMRALLQVVKDMGEIREEVKVSGGRLYDYTDRTWIIRGIGEILIYLQEGVTEYSDWSAAGGRRRRTRGRDRAGMPASRPNDENAWVVELVDDYDVVPRRWVGPGDDEWPAPGGMPPEYEVGLEQSKLIMRAYVYGASRKARAEHRKKVQKCIDAREATQQPKKSQPPGPSR